MSPPMPAGDAGRPAVFLDRDGTINVEVDYLSDPADFELIPGAGEALRALAEAGFALVVITNQSGIARGLLSEQDLAAIHARMEAELAPFGVHFDAIESCPHHPEVGEPPYRRTCSCRKPAAGMLQKAIRSLDLDPSRSWTIGDSLRDLQAGSTAGTRTILVRTGKGAAQEPKLSQSGPADGQVVDDLTAAVELILSNSSL